MLGLARDIVIARFFSASDAADAFFVAFKIPNFLRRLFAEGAFSLAFVPVLTEYRNNYSAAQTRDLIDRVAGTLGFILLLLSADRRGRVAAADRGVRRGLHRSAGQVRR